MKNASKNSLTKATLLSALLFAGFLGCDNYRPTPQTGVGARETTEVLELRTRVSKATDVFTRLTTAQELQVPASIINKARCIAVIPDVFQAAFFAGGKYGHGVVSCRTEDNTWSAPAFVTLGGASFGIQVGANQSNILLFFMDDVARRSLLSRNVTLGGDVAVTAGPVGRGTSGSTDIEFTGIVSYSMAQGLFAGLSLQGSVFEPDDQANSAYYGQQLSMPQLLFGNAVSLTPAEAGRFIGSLPS